MQGGIDYINVDVTNWPMVNVGTDVSVLRPIEVLFEEWLKLRRQGIPTPQIAVWPCSPRNSTTWKYLLDNVYANASYDELIYKQNGKKVVFLPYNSGCYNAEEEQLILSNGGKKDTVTVKMWALFKEKDYNNDVWGFFSPCLSNKQYTTSVVGNQKCDQYVSRKNFISAPTEITASPSYQITAAALPFSAVGKFRGLTIQKQFEKILSNPNVQHVFVSSYNEHIGGREQIPIKSNLAYCMGLPNDSQKSQVWVDTYAYEFSRDMEPSVEGGSLAWMLLASCVSLYKQGKSCADAPTAICCSTKDKDIFQNIWSLQNKQGDDFLITESDAEKTQLVKQGWKEICHPIAGPASFCVDTGMTDGRQGPFIIYKVNQTEFTPLYRCLSAQGKHFISTAANCEGQKTERLLGYISKQRGGETLRSIKRCRTAQDPSSPKTHSLDLDCDVADSDILGFVR